MIVIKMKYIVLWFLGLIVFSQAYCLEVVKKERVAEAKKAIDFDIIKKLISAEEYENDLRHVFIRELDFLLDVRETNNGLVFTLQNKKKIVFENNGKEDNLEYKKYSYFGSLNKMLALFSVDGYEHNELFLINMYNGSSLDLVSYPYANKKSTMFFTYSNNVEVDYFDNKINLYKIDDAGAIKVNESSYLKNLAPIEMYWISDNEIIVKMLEINNNDTYIYEKWKIEDRKIK